MRFRRGMIVCSADNDIVRYKIIKVNKESLDVSTVSDDKNLHGHSYHGVSKEMFTPC